MSNKPDENQTQVPPGANPNPASEEQQQVPSGNTSNLTSGGQPQQGPARQEPQQPKQNAFGRVMDATVGGFARWLGQKIENRLISENIYERARIIAEREKAKSQVNAPQANAPAGLIGISQTQEAVKPTPAPPSTRGEQQSSGIPPDVLRFKKEKVDKPYEALKSRYESAVTTTPAEELEYRRAKANWEMWQKPEHQKQAAEIFALGGRSSEAIDVYNKARDAGKSHKEALSKVQEWARNYTPPKQDPNLMMRKYNLAGTPEGSLTFDPQTGTVQVVGMPGLDPEQKYRVIKTPGMSLPKKEGDSFFIEVHGPDGVRYQNIQVTGGGLRKVDPTNRLKQTPSGLWMWGNDVDGFGFVSDEMAKKIFESEAKRAELQGAQVQKVQESILKNTHEAHKTMLTHAQKLLSDTEARISKGEATLEGSLPVYLNYMKEANRYFKASGQQEPFQMFDPNQWDLIGPHKVNGEVARDPLTGMPLVQLKNKTTKEVRVWKFSRG